MSDPPRRDWLMGTLGDLQLDLATSALVIIDMQQGYTDRGNVRGEWIRANDPEMFEYFFDRIDLVRTNLATILQLFRAKSLPVVHVTFGSERSDRRDMVHPAHRRLPAWAPSHRDLEPFRVGGPEHAIVEELAPAPGEYRFNKTGHSAFTTTALELVLRSIGVRQLLVGGWATDACVGLTARDAADRGFEVFLIDDACAAFTAESHTASVENFSRLYGRVVVARDVVHDRE